MYSFIVKKLVRNSFKHLSGGDYLPALHLMAEHALGGNRSHRTLIAQWFERYMRVLPGFIFTPAEVVVNGWPWKTIIAVKLNVSWLRPDGEVYKNVALQMITLRWFKAVDIITIDDTSGFGALLNDLVNKFGVEEAGAKPIEG